ncbi:precorrin-6Y C5,15-methyltransferase (decarboxylating) subunit CbiT [Halobaculum sp. MBLA0147]|uniref:precorrin-6Y C5,15-methyltransferase (decarboxylating) subunit CbiT n=1 Tax=Halobaculum sp. MBLA0147 TaxID=3079934 RepID=UPI00352470BE
MSTIRLPRDAKAGPTKPEVRAVVRQKLALDDDEHVVEVGACTGAVTATVARDAGRVTALERVAEKLDATEANLAANDCRDAVELVAAEAPDGLPDDYDALFLGGTRNYEAVLDHAVATGVDRVVTNVSRLEVAGGVVDAYRERDLLEDVVQFQVSHGYELAGATSFDAENPVYTVVGSASDGSGSDTDTGTAGGEP